MRFGKLAKSTLLSVNRSGIDLRESLKHCLSVEHGVSHQDAAIRLKVRTRSYNEKTKFLVS